MRLGHYIQDGINIISYCCFYLWKPWIRLTDILLYNRAEGCFLCFCCLFLYRYCNAASTSEMTLRHYDVDSTCIETLVAGLLYSHLSGCFWILGLKFWKVVGTIKSYLHFLHSRVPGMTKLVQPALVRNEPPGIISTNLFFVFDFSWSRNWLFDWVCPLWTFQW